MYNEKLVSTDDRFTIDDEFMDLLSLNSEDFELLEKRIIEDKRCNQPLVIWTEERLLVDGHNRYAVCQKHSIDYDVIEKSFTDRDAVKIWMFENQKGRRNMNKFQWAVSVLKLKPIYEEQAKARQSAGGGSDRKKSSEPGRTMDKLAEIAGISAPTLRQVELILQHADQATIDKLNSGHSDYSINGVHTALLESLDEGREVRVGIVRRKPNQQTIVATPPDGSMSRARLKAKERASQLSRGKMSQGLAEQVDAVLVLLEELEQDFPVTEDRIYIYEAVNVWQNEGRHDLE